MALLPEKSAPWTGLRTISATEPLFPEKLESNRLISADLC